MERIPAVLDARVGLLRVKRGDSAEPFLLYGRVLVRLPLPELQWAAAAVG